jgi:hypothetical protein
MSCDVDFTCLFVGGPANGKLLAVPSQLNGDHRLEPVEFFEVSEIVRHHRPTACQMAEARVAYRRESLLSVCEMNYYVFVLASTPVTGVLPEMVRNFAQLRYELDRLKGHL